MHFGDGVSGSSGNLSKPGRVFCFTKEASSLRFRGRAAARHGRKRLLRKLESQDTFLVWCFGVRRYLL